MSLNEYVLSDEEAKTIQFKIRTRYRKAPRDQQQSLTSGSLPFQYYMCSTVSMSNATPPGFTGADVSPTLGLNKVTSCISFLKQIMI